MQNIEAIFQILDLGLKKEILKKAVIYQQQAKVKKDKKD